MARQREEHLWTALAVPAMLIGWVCFCFLYPSDKESSPLADKRPVERIVTTQLSPRQYALLSQQMRSYVREIIMSSGSAKSSSSASEPTHPMPCCEGQMVSDTLYATVTTPKFGPVTVELTYSDSTPNAGSGWYGHTETCEGLILSVIVHSHTCVGAMMLAEIPWHEGPEINQICIAGDSTFGFDDVTCDPLILEASTVAWGMGSITACRCGIESVEDLSPATVIVTE